MARSHKTSKLDYLNSKVVWHKELVGFMHVVGVVELTLVDVLMVMQVV